jgi:hypothetical protein
MRGAAVDDGHPIDAERVITALERQIGQQAGQIARLEAVIASLLEQRNDRARADDAAATDQAAGAEG